MSSTIVPIRTSRSELNELAKFLAAFVADGELANPLPGDDQPETWRQRMEWWWTENPFRREDSPLGFTLRAESGKIVGFHGLIPFDYLIDGKDLPGLISCLFFVRSEYRPDSMGIFLKIQRLTRTYHLVDGGPSDRMVQILERFSYRRGAERNFYFYSMLLPKRKRPLPSGLLLETDPTQIRSVRNAQDEKIRRKVTPESLQWLTRVGRKERLFFAACNNEGEAIAYAIGEIKKLPGGFKGCQVIDYGSFDESLCEVRDLLGTVSSHRRQFSLPPRLALLIWGVENGARPPANRFKLKRESKVYHHGPVGLESREKVILPIEGDYCFF